MQIALFNEGSFLREKYYTKGGSYTPPVDAFIVKDFEEKEYYSPKVLKIGKDKELELNNIEVVIDLEKKQLYTESEIYLNFQKVSGKVDFKYGDNIIVGYVYKVQFISENKIKVLKYMKNKKIKLVQTPANSGDDYPYYYSSPRYLKPLNEEDVSLELPPEKDKKNTVGDLLKKLIPLFISLFIAVLMLKIRPRGIRGLLMITSSIVSASITVITLYQDRKEAKEHNKKRKQVYDDYLMEKRMELNSLKKNEIEAYHYNAISQSEVLHDIKRSVNRLYEREFGNEDFLDLRLGVNTKEVTYKIKNPSEKLKLEKEQFELDIIEVYEQYKEVEDVARIIGLEKNNTAFTLEKSVYTKQMYNYLLQLIYSNSYNDTKFIFIGNEADQEDYKLFRYAKHFYNDISGVYNFVYNDSQKEQVLNPYLNMIRDRELEGLEGQKPHLLFIITDYKLIRDHPIMEYLLKDNTKLGFSLLFLVENEDTLPHIVNTIIEFRNSKEAIIKLYANKELNEEVKLEEINTDKTYLEKVIRKIGSYEHIQGVKSSIPTKLGFLEMFEVETVEELNISKRWQENRSYNSLAALVGKKTETDFIELNLHEKVHGPHGLVAGTTGSGKSEVIQTYILSLALNYSPEEVGFLLIDYKGGGMANLFKNMPHHLGSITNLDGYQSMRALASIKSELKRRQAIFSDVEVNHIDGYQKLYEKGSVQEPLPHLFIISDEFAELKSEQPEFMKELVSAARIGRSLGIHLILATQKPAGVVDDQIWSNSKFKLSLKVAEEADSRELLKTPDAAYIQNPGRGYLKVGNNELYELFQSGYSGAPYSQSSQGKFNKEVLEVDIVGRQKVLVEREKEEETTETELDAVLNQIEKEYEVMGYQEVKRPWLAPLPDKIVVEKKINNLKDEIANLNVEYGLIDLPNSQSQTPLVHSLEKDGHLAIFGASQMGKSMTLMSLAMTLAQQNSPELLKYFVFDLGNSTLIHLKGLMHTAEYLKVEDEDRIKKTLKIIEKEILIRKSLFERKMVNNFASYNKVAGVKKEAIVMFLDNFDALKDMDKDLIDMFVSIIREGASLGIYFVTTALKSNSMKSAIINSINNRVVLFTNDKSDVSTLIGRSSYPQQELAGRAQIKVDDIEVAQLYYPIEHETESEYIEFMSEYVNEINAQTNGVQNVGIEEMPQNYDVEIKDAMLDKIYLGKEYNETSDFYFELTQATLIQGEIKSGKSNVIKLIVEQLKNNYKIALFDDMMKSLYMYSQDEKVSYIDQLKDTMYKNDIFIFNKLDFLNSLDKKVQKEVYELLYKEFLKGKYFVIETMDALKGSYDFVKMFKRPTTVLWIDDVNVQKFARIKDKDMKQEEKDKFDIYYIQGKDVIKVKPPKLDIGTDIKFEEQEEMELEVGGSILENETMVIAGKNSLKVVNKLKEAYADFGLEVKEIDVENMEAIEGEQEETVFLLNSLTKLDGMSRDERIQVYDKLLGVYKKHKMLILLDVPKLSGVHDFIKLVKKPERAIVSDNLGEQKYKKVKNRDYKETVVQDNEAYYIYEKIVKKVEL